MSSPVRREDRPKAVVVSFSDLGRNPRVYRQLRSLLTHFAVTAVGFGDPGVGGAQYLPLAPPRKPLARRFAAGLRLLARRYESYYWRKSDVLECLRKIRPVGADLFVAHEIDTLPVVLRLAAGAKVLFDAYEYSPRQFDDRLSFRVFHKRMRTYFCRQYIPRADAMITVCSTIADAYERDTGVKPTVVLNTPDREDLEPFEPVAHPDRIALVHHGIASRSRRLENIIKVMGYLDARFELSLYLIPGDSRYLAELKRMAAGDPRIQFRDPVPMPMLTRALNPYDVGICVIAPANFNLRFALPNKLFEFVQARLAVVVGPSPEMAAVVREHGLGLVSQDFEPATLARLLRGLDREQVRYFKRRSHQAARELAWGTRSQQTFMDVVERLGAGRGERYRR